MFRAKFSYQVWIRICLIFLSLNPLESSPVIKLTNTISEKEMECFSQEKIYHKPTDKCYKLLTTGPCPRGQWFALEKPRKRLRRTRNTTIRASCARQICQDGEYYWSKLNYCVQAKDKKLLCGDTIGEELVTNVFGEGECMCTRDPPRARFNGDKRGKCYLLYSQGPCLPSQVFGFLRPEVASCIPDPCYAESLFRKKNKTLRKDSILAAWENGTCYELGTQGPCPEGVIFKVLSSVMIPKCVTLTNSLFELEKSRNCFEDEQGKCQKQININKNQTALNYRRELIKRYVGVRKKRTTKENHGIFNRSLKNNTDRWLWRNR